MLANPLLHHILGDDTLTRRLGDAEARVLVEWLVEQTEDLAENLPAAAAEAESAASAAAAGPSLAS